MRYTLTKTLRSGFLIIAFSLTIKGVSAQTCGTPPTCDSLGYQQTSSDCDGVKRVLKCPFDTSKLFCVELPPESCEVGSILYSDKSCSMTVKSGKTAIGVVFDTNKRLAVALEQASSTMMWSPSGKTSENVTSLSDCSDTSTVYDCNPNGNSNTSKIVSQYGSSTSYAAGYCASYSTSGTEAGDWFLPSMEELRSILNTQEYVNASLALLGKAPIIPDVSYWSSIEDGDSSSWKLSMDSGVIGYYRKDYGYDVRPVVAY